MSVNVDEPWHNVETLDVDRFAGLSSRNIGRDLRDFACGNGHVHNPADLVLGVDDMAAFEEQIVERLCMEGKCSREENQGSHQKISLPPNCITWNDFVHR